MLTNPSARISTVWKLHFERNLLHRRIVTSDSLLRVVLILRFIFFFEMVTLPPPFGDVPRVPLLFKTPSEIEKLERLTAAIDTGISFWIKREDCNSGLAYGGNKVRKLEYVIPDALAKGADTLLTTGGLQSNHMRQTAAAAARLGLKVSSTLTYTTHVALLTWPGRIASASRCCI